MDKTNGRKIFNFSLAMTAIVAIATIVNLFNGNTETVSRSQLEPQDKIEVIAVGLSVVTGDRVDAWVKNVGLGTISLIEKAEIIVGVPGVRLNTMKYRAGGGNNTWIEDPVGSSWDPGDTLHLIITLPSGSPLATGNHTFRVSTSTGTNANKSFYVR